MENELKKPKYKVGQQVRVRNDLTPKLWKTICHGTGVNYNPNCPNYYGKTVTINSVLSITENYPEPTYEAKEEGICWGEQCFLPPWTTLTELNTSLLNGEVSIEDYNRYREELK